MAIFQVAVTVGPPCRSAIFEGSPLEFCKHTKQTNKQTQFKREQRKQQTKNMTTLEWQYPIPGSFGTRPLVNNK